MSSCEGRFVTIGVVFHALYFENEVGDPLIFWQAEEKAKYYICCKESYSDVTFNLVVKCAEKISLFPSNSSLKWTRPRCIYNN